MQAIMDCLRGMFRPVRKSSVPPVPAVPVPLPLIPPVSSRSTRVDELKGMQWQIIPGKDKETHATLELFGCCPDNRLPNMFREIIADYVELRRVIEESSSGSIVGLRVDPAVAISLWSQEALIMTNFCHAREEPGKIMVHGFGFRLSYETPPIYLALDILPVTERFDGFEYVVAHDAHFCTLQRGRTETYFDVWR